MAQDALDTAQRKVERAEARAARATKERIGAFAALGMAMEERDYAAAHPLLKPEPEPVEVEDVTA